MQKLLTLMTMITLLGTNCLTLKTMRVLRVKKGNQVIHSVGKAGDVLQIMPKIVFKNLPNGIDFTYNCVCATCQTFISMKPNVNSMIGCSNRECPRIEKDKQSRFVSFSFKYMHHVYRENTHRFANEKLSGEMTFVSPGNGCSVDVVWSDQ